MGETTPSREQIVEDLKREIENVVLSDAVLNMLRMMKRVSPVFYAYLSRERRRKKRSTQFQWVIEQMCRPQLPVDNSALTNFKDLLLAMRKQMEGQELPPDTGKKMLVQLQNFMKTRKEPKYWREYMAYRDGKEVAEILREFHPAYDGLHTWEREKYFRKVYNAIQRLVEKYGGRPLLRAAPKQF
jgi:hypothetical protein